MSFNWSLNTFSRLLFLWKNTVDVSSPITYGLFLSLKNPCGKGFKVKNVPESTRESRSIESWIHPQGRPLNNFPPCGKLWSPTPGLNDSERKESEVRRVSLVLHKAPNLGKEHLGRPVFTHANGSVPLLQPGLWTWRVSVLLGPDAGGQCWGDPAASVHSGHVWSSECVNKGFNLS